MIKYNTAVYGDIHIDVQINKDSDRDGHSYAHKYTYGVFLKSGEP
jgi:hypothetical protein